MTEKEISENEEIALSGNWNIKYNLPKKFYNRTAIVYSVKSCSNPDFKITEACLYNTGFRFDFELNLKNGIQKMLIKKNVIRLLKNMMNGIYLN